MDVRGADTRGVTSASLWDSLRTTCLHMKRIDLAAYCDHRDLDGKRHSINFADCRTDSRARYSQGDGSGVVNRYLAVYIMCGLLH